MIDRWTDKFFWPALVGAWVGVVAGPAAALMPHPFMGLVQPTTWALTSLAAAMFLVMLFDRPTRHAIDKFNFKQKALWRERTWKDRFFSTDYGDPRLLIVNRVVWLEMIVCLFSGRMDLAVLCFASFAVSTIMLLLMMKRRAVGPSAEGR